MTKIQKEEIITARGLWEEERNRCIEKPNESNFKEWLGNREYPLDWMKKQFGETLTEKTDFIHPSGDRFDEADCKVCGKESKPDEEVIKLTFSFCDEYGCGIIICKKCLRRLSRLTEKESSTK